MPALSIPCDDGNASVLVNAGAVIFRGRVYADAMCTVRTGNTYVHEIRYKSLTSNEFRACPWESSVAPCTISERAFSLEIMISAGGTDLSAKTRGVNTVFVFLMHPVPFKLNDWLSPRIKWIAKYAEIKKRRTAVAMATHKRLGGGSLLTCLNKDTIQMVIAFASE
jgi:hypothetical protein